MCVRHICHHPAGKQKKKIQDMQQDFQHVSCNDVFARQHHGYKLPYRGTSRWLDIILQTLDCQVVIGL